MRKLTAIYLCSVFSLLSVAALSGCGASDSGGCGGRSRADHFSDITERIVSSRATISPISYVKTSTFEFSQRSGRGNRFNTTTTLSGFPSGFRAVAEESDSSFAPLPGPGELVTIGTSQSPCGPEPNWTLNMEVYDGRASAGRRLQANHSYTIVSDTSTPEEFSKLRIHGGKGAGDFIAQTGSIIVESVNETVIVLRLKDLLFVHVGGNGKPDGGGFFVLNGVIDMES